MLYVYTVEGTAFLRHMVRRIVGMLVDVEIKGKSQNVPVDKFGLFRFERVATGNSSLYLKKGDSNEGLIELIL